ncbi:hypothetical protein IIC68_03910, partial [archaeon]|nr:hypothetical protein [archaeon]
MDEFEGLEEDFAGEKSGIQMPGLPVDPKIIAAGIIGLIIILVLFFVVLTPQGQSTLTVKVENDSGQEL